MVSCHAMAKSGPNGAIGPILWHETINGCRQPVQEKKP